MTDERLERALKEQRDRRRALSLVDFIKDVEAANFRTNSDTGANDNALFVWNILREYAGMPKLTHDELRQRQVDTSSDKTLTVESLKEFEKWYREYHDFTDFPMRKEAYERVVAKGGRDYLFPPKD